MRRAFLNDGLRAVPEVGGVVESADRNGRRSQEWQAPPTRWAGRIGSRCDHLDVVNNVRLLRLAACSLIGIDSRGLEEICGGAHTRFEGGRHVPHV